MWCHGGKSVSRVLHYLSNPWWENFIANNCHQNSESPLDQTSEAGVHSPLFKFSRNNDPLPSSDICASKRTPKSSLTAGLLHLRSMASDYGEDVRIYIYYSPQPSPSIRHLTSTWDRSFSNRRGPD